MPNYDLRCADCQHEFIAKATIAERTDRVIPCPACGSFELDAVFKKAPAVIKRSAASECPNRALCGGGCRHAQ